ncbi:MAG: hypothetical protein NZV14_13285 [Bryobacteraceae bacterium]|nr:hypothetical protein [Bryobacteraceae bacterium]MDW8379130.1 hypothetical protein [Bryobacterales bacterium]
MSPTLALAFLGSFGAALLILVGWLLLGKRRSAEERERARRRFLSLRGRVAEAEVTDVDGLTLCYCYQVGGVTYHSTQDAALFAHMLPQDLSLLLGPAVIKYAPGNPANSILISEEWSGIRLAKLPSLAKSKGD